MQTSYERVKRALYFQNPDQLPVVYPGLGISDFHYVKWNQTGTGDKSKKETVDEWGCVWSRSEVANMGLVTGNPLQDWDNLATYEWPNPDDEKFYVGMEKQFEGSEGKYVITDIFGLLFERMHHLRGFENALMDLYIEREKAEMLADRIVEFDIRVIENISKRFPGRIHGLNYGDDWGTEISTFISCELFDEFFAPRYKKICDACKKAGWDVWMHSCGKVNTFLPKLIECGVNAFNLQQPNTNGIEELGAQLAGKACFYTCCDIQKTLIYGTAEEIEAEAIKLMNCWGTENGGFVLFEYEDGDAIGCSMERKKIMYDAFVRNDRWKK